MAQTNKTYTREFRIQIHEVDAAGIVFFGRYFYLMHDVYEAFLDVLGNGIAWTIANTEYIIPIVHAQSQYHRPMRHGETITAELQLKELKHSSFVVETRFIGTDSVHRATITTQHVCVHAGRMKPMALPDDLRGRLAQYVTAEPVPSTL